MEQLRRQEQKILDALISCQQEKGYSPSYRELASKVGFKSTNTVDYYLTKLEAIRIPVLGTVPAGVPNLALEDQDEFIDVDKSLAKGKVFGLHVKGDSMKDAGILEGDVVIVRVQSTAENGEIVVARFEDDATVKYFRKKKNGIYLVPANEKYKAISAKEAQIVGKVTGVIRRY